MSMQQQSALCSLPTELLSPILDHLQREVEVPEFQGPPEEQWALRKINQKDVLQITNGLLKSCKLLREHFLPRLYTQHEFFFEDDKDQNSGQWQLLSLVQWHGGLLPFARNMIRRMYLSLHACFDHDMVQPKALEAFASLPSLEQVILTHCPPKSNYPGSVVDSDWAYWTVQALAKISGGCPKLTKVYCKPVDVPLLCFRGSWTFRLCEEGCSGEVQEQEFNLEQEWFVWSAWQEEHPDMDPGFGEMDIDLVDVEWWEDTPFSAHANILEEEECRNMMLG